MQQNRDWNEADLRAIEDAIAALLRAMGQVGPEADGLCAAVVVDLIGLGDKVAKSIGRADWAYAHAT